MHAICPYNDLYDLKEADMGGQHIHVTHQTHFKCIKLNYILIDSY